MTLCTANEESNLMQTSLSHTHTRTRILLFKVQAGSVPVTELFYLCQAATEAKRITKRGLTTPPPPQKKRLNPD